MAMKVDPAQAPAWRMYPHIVRRHGGRDVRWDVHVTNEPLGEDRAGWHAAYAFACLGAIEGDRVTDRGRAAIVRQLQAAMHPDDEACVVWGPRACTFVCRTATADGRDPPHGDPMDANALSRLSFVELEGAWFALPTGSACTHLFLRRLDYDRAEIATAAPVRLADWDQPLRAGETDPFASCFDEQGGFVRPRRFAGVETTGLDGTVLLGPVQPDGAAHRLVRPWPSEVRAACIELAGRPLPADTLGAAWTAIDRMAPGSTRSGAVRVA